MIITPITTPLNIPNATPVLIDLFPDAVPPLANISGIIPTINAREVMIIGRKRDFAPSKADSGIDNPDFLRCTANSTIKMAFFANNPMSVISPTCT